MASELENLTDALTHLTEAIETATNPVRAMKIALSREGQMNAATLRTHIGRGHTIAGIVSNDHARCDEILNSLNVAAGVVRDRIAHLRGI